MGVSKKPPPAPIAAPASSDAGQPAPDFEKLAQNAPRVMQELGKIGNAYFQPRDTSDENQLAAQEMRSFVRTLGQVAERWMASPEKALEAQTALSKSMIELWGQTLKRLQGEAAAPVAEPEPRDSRFADPSWAANPYFDFLKQSYLLTTRWAGDMVQRAEGLDADTRQKADFYVKQLSAALSPSNFVPTNPELIQATLAEGGENLVRGMSMLAEDIAAGGGEVRIRQTDGSQFAVGVNLATAPGKVIFRNDLIELLQYAPATEKVQETPVMFVPPWINKFYILDHTPEKSMIRWMVDQGFTVFVVSWVNPDARHRHLDFTGYMEHGILAGMNAALKETKAKTIHTVGYCVGGTLLAATLGWLAAKGDKRIETATFLTTQVDFTYAGDLKVFVDEAQVHATEQAMAKHGYLPAAKMAGAFNMLRPKDLIWSYVVNNYLKGKAPMPFDLLYWNSDSTRMPEANHSFYLRNCYLGNKLSKGEMEVGGIRIDLSKVTVPVYNLASQEDHIAPARSVFLGSRFFGGKVKYVMGGSGHIAGVINHPAKPKYFHYTGGDPNGDFDEWVAKARKNPGSWWPDWAAWLKQHAPKQVKARKPGKVLKPLGDAPGDYVRAKG